MANPKVQVNIMIPLDIYNRMNDIIENNQGVDKESTDKYLPQNKTAYVREAVKQYNNSYNNTEFDPGIPEDDIDLRAPA